MMLRLPIPIAVILPADGADARPAVLDANDRVAVLKVYSQSDA